MAPPAMRKMAPLHVARILGDVQKDSDFVAFTKPPMSGRFRAFRQDVELVQAWCLLVPPEATTTAEIRERLERLHAATYGVLHRLRHHIERAQAALDNRDVAVGAAESRSGAA